MIDFVRTMTARKARRGAIALEYALVLAFVAVAVLAALLTLGTKLSSTIGVVGDKVSSAADETYQ